MNVNARGLPLFEQVVTTFFPLKQISEVCSWTGLTYSLVILEPSKSTRNPRGRASWQIWKESLKKRRARLSTRDTWRKTKFWHRRFFSTVTEPRRRGIFAKKGGNLRPVKNFQKWVRYRSFSNIHVSWKKQRMNIFLKKHVVYWFPFPKTCGAVFVDD